jgi:hypothetical protein
MIALALGSRSRPQSGFWRASDGEATHSSVPLLQALSHQVSRMNNLTQFDMYLRALLSSRSVPVSDFVSPSFNRDAYRWRVGPRGAAHLLVVSEEALELGTDLTESLRRMAIQFNWPGNVEDHKGKAYLFLSDGSVREERVEDFPA